MWLFCLSGRSSRLLTTTHTLLLNQNVPRERLLRSDAYSHQGILSSQTSSVVNLVKAKRRRENEGPREAKKEVNPSAPREEPVLACLQSDENPRVARVDDVSASCGLRTSPYSQPSAGGYCLDGREEMQSPLTRKTSPSTERWNPWRFVGVGLQYQYARHPGFLTSDVHHDIDQRIALYKMGLHRRREHLSLKPTRKCGKGSSSTLAYRSSRQERYLPPAVISAGDGSMSFCPSSLAHRLPTHLHVLKSMATHCHRYPRPSTTLSSFRTPATHSPRSWTTRRPCLRTRSRDGIPTCTSSARSYRGYSRL